MPATEPASSATTPLADLPSAGLSDPAIALFLMINTFETGGSERQFTVLAQNLTLPQFRTHLGCISRRGPARRQLLGRSRISPRRQPLRMALAAHSPQPQPPFAPASRASRPALDFYTNLTLIPAARFARVPVVIGSHRQLGDLMTPAQFRAQAAAFRWCDAVVCNSVAAADRLIAAGLSQNKVAIIGNALPAEDFQRRAPGAAEASRHTPRQHGRAHESSLRKSFRISAHRRPDPSTDAECRVRSRRGWPAASRLGEGSVTPRPRRRRHLPRDRQDMPAVLASIDVAVNTSDSESLSNVILEAIAAGLPVVAYNVGGNAELLSHQGGALIPAGNETSFADAVQNLLTDPALRQQLGRNALQFAQENFSLDRVR